MSDTSLTVDTAHQFCTTSIDSVAKNNKQGMPCARKCNEKNENNLTQKHRKYVSLSAINLSGRGQIKIDPAGACLCVCLVNRGWKRNSQKCYWCIQNTFDGISGRRALFTSTMFDAHLFTFICWAHNHKYVYVLMAHMMTRLHSARCTLQTWQATSFHLPYMSVRCPWAPLDTTQSRYEFCLNDITPTCSAVFRC